MNVVLPIPFLLRCLKREYAEPPHHYPAATATRGDDIFADGSVWARLDAQLAAYAARPWQPSDFAGNPPIVHGRARACPLGMGLVYGACVVCKAHFLKEDEQRGCREQAY